MIARSLSGQEGSPLMNQISEAIAEITDQQRKGTSWTRPLRTSQRLTVRRNQHWAAATVLTSLLVLGRCHSELASILGRDRHETLWVSLTGTLIGLLIGLAVGIIRTIPKSREQIHNGVLKVTNLLLNAYVAIFRGTPMIVQTMIFYYGTDLLWGWKLTPMSAAFPSCLH